MTTLDYSMVISMGMVNDPLSIAVESDDIESLRQIGHDLITQCKAYHNAKIYSRSNGLCIALMDKNQHAWIETEISNTADEDRG